MLNETVPAANQVWTHVKTGLRILILEITGDGHALSAIVTDTEGRPTKPWLYLSVPIPKLRDYGNRGFRFMRMRPGRAPSVDWKNMEFPPYNPRKKMLGA